MAMHNHAAMTRRALESLWQSGHAPDEVVLVDNASEEAPPTDPRWRTIRLSENYSLARALNVGIKATRAPIIVLLNNDLTIRPGGLNHLTAPLSDPAVVTGQRGALLDADLRHRCHTDVSPDYLEFFCVAFTREAYAEVGPLDEAMRPIYAEDSDWCLRAQALGYRLQIVRECVDHIGGASSRDNPLLQEASERNRVRLLAKHGRRETWPRPGRVAGRPCVGHALCAMADGGVSGGAKVALRMMLALRDAGWDVTVWFVNQRAPAWGEWQKLPWVRNRQGLRATYDLGVSTFHSTMPFIANVPCEHRLALIQSDEPEWGADSAALDNFRLSGFKHVVIAAHMQEFRAKYGMDIVGQIDNGVDDLTFYPDWVLERAWPHSLMLTRKNAPAWYAGEEYAERAVALLARAYSDLEVVVVGGERPKWPCRVRHVQTYDEGELRRAYNSVSCFVRPSLVEGSSLTDLEALACGTPLVCTPIGTDWAIDGENCLLVPCKDPQAIADAASRIFDGPGLRERLARGGLRVTRERTWEREQKQWLDVVARVVGSNASNTVK